MEVNPKRTAKTALVAAFLILQVLLGWFSTVGAWEISSSCTVSASTPLEWFFNSVHFALLAALFLGLISLRFSGLRRIYVGVIIAALLTLPIQAILVWNGALWCDAP